MKLKILTRSLGFLICCIASLTSAALADDDCTALLKHGLYDYASTVTSNANASTFQSDFCQTYNHYTSDKVNGTVQASYGLFSGSLSLSKDQVDSLGQMLCTSTFTNSQAQTALTTTSSVIDGAAVNAFNACVSLNSTPDGLRVVPQSSLVDPQNIDLSVRYISPAGPPKTASLQYVAYDRTQMTCTGDLITNTSKIIDSSFRGMTCRRKLYASPQSLAIGGSSTEKIMAPATTITLSTDAGQYVETVAAIAAAPIPPPAASVPLGGVIAWYRFRTADPIPDGYWVADGSTINDPNSAFNGTNAPNLVDHFVMGVTLGRMAENGGNNAIPMDGGGTFNYSGTTSNAGANSDGWKIGGDRGCCPQADGLNHTHTYSGSITIPNHNHGGDNRPAYLGLLYLVRVR